MHGRESAQQSETKYTNTNLYKYTCVDWRNGMSKGTVVRQNSVVKCESYAQRRSRGDARRFTLSERAESFSGSRNHHSRNLTIVNNQDLKPLCAASFASNPEASPEAPTKRKRTRRRSGRGGGMRTEVLGVSTKCCVGFLVADCSFKFWWEPCFFCFSFST